MESTQRIYTTGVLWHSPHTNSWISFHRNCLLILVCSCANASADHFLSTKCSIFRLIPAKQFANIGRKKREKQDRTIDIRDDLSISLANIASLDSMNCRYFETYTFCVNVQTSQNPICYCQRIYTSASHCGCTQFQFEWWQYVQVIREFIVGANCMITTLPCWIFIILAITGA